MYPFNLAYYLKYYKNWIISGLIFTVLFFISVLLSYEWSLRFLGVNTPLVSFVYESLSHTLFLYGSIVLLGIVLVVFVRLIGFFRSKDVEALLQMTTEELRGENLRLTEEVRRYFSILMRAPTGILITRAERVLLCNEMMFPFLEEKPEQAIGRSMIGLFPSKEEAGKIFEKGRTILLRNKSWMTQSLMTTRDGRRILYQITAFCLKEGAPKKGIVWIFQDYSAEARNIELEKYYQTVFRVLMILHHFNDNDNEYDLFKQMLNEVIGIYGLKTAFFLDYRDKKLHINFVVGEDHAFPGVQRIIDLEDPALKDVAVVKAFMTQKAMGFSDIRNIRYYKESFYRRNKKPVLSTYAFPIIIEGKVEGVVSLYGHTVGFFSDSLVFRLQQLLSEICENIAAIRLRRRTQIAIHQYEEKLRLQIHELEGNKKIMQKQADELTVVIRDLTEARDAAESANKAKSDFLANMSHELRTPLNAILGFSEAMETEVFGPLPSQYKEYVQYVYSSGKYLLSLINDILDLSSVEGGHQKLVDTRVPVDTFIESVINVVKRYPGGEKRTIRWQTHCPGAELLIDERSLKQIFLNILSNSIKFTQEGGLVDIDISMTRRKEMRIIVSDNGVGIPKDKIGQLFQPFSQVENVMTRKHKGTGLGLVLIKRLMELQQGSVQLESEYGHGTRLILTFPKERVFKAKRKKA